MRYPLGAIVVMLTIAGRVHAQSSAVGEQLFNEARELAKANRWAEACPKFEASLRADPALGTRLNLATCYENVGKLASAWGLYRESVDFATKAGDGKRADYARKQADALEPRLPKLIISAPANPPTGLVISRDKAPVDAGALGVALYVDPGAHEVTASAPGFEEFKQTVTLVEGKTETLAIPALVAKPVDEGSSTDGRVDKTVSVAPASQTRKYVGLGVAAAGVVATGVGLVFGAKANSTYGDAVALCGTNVDCSGANFPKGQQLVHDARTSATISTVLVVGGGVAIAAGVIVWLTAPRKQERATARMTPLIQDHGGGLAVVGQF